MRDRALPPDHEAFVAAEPPSGRVIVIAPTRAACETIEIALGLHVETVLEREHGEEIRALARSRVGFGIVAGTGTGKTLAIRPIAEELLAPEPLRVGVVNREREATPETPTWNVIIVTTGIARRWFEDGDILARDTLVVDEIQLVGSRCGPFPDALAMLARGEVDVAGMITGRFELDRAIEAIQAAKNPENIKVLLKM